MNDSSSRHLFSVFGLALAVLLMLSAMPWSSLTGNVIKDFNLFEELFTSDSDDTLIEDVPFVTEVTAASVTEIPDAPAADCPEAEAPVTLVEEAAVAEVPAAVTPQIIDGVLAIESYLPAGNVFPKFLAALGETDQRLVRVAFIGDSFIEGDILCQDLRDILQARFGGSGVGYMAMHTDFPGFRGSVRQSDSGWKMRDVRSMRSSDSLRVLSGEYAVAEGNARTKYQGVTTSPRMKEWSRTSLLFFSPTKGTISFETAEGATTFDVEESPDLQALVVDGTTDAVTIKSDIPGLKVLGAYLDTPSGIQVDCMSVRGYAGLAHGRTSYRLSRDAARWIDYDLIIIEYGMNALNARQSNYRQYGKSLAEVTRHIASCYPGADILIMGVSDRGTKNGSSVVTLPTCQAMVNAQRDAAREAGVHFWDTREAMGGPGSCADWRKRKLMNADYTHLNHAGGREMASLLSKAIINATQQN